MQSKSIVVYAKNVQSVIFYLSYRMLQEIQCAPHIALLFEKDSAVDIVTQKRFADAANKTVIRPL